MAFTILGVFQLKKIGDCKNIYCVNPLYLGITHASGYIEKMRVNKYLIFDSIDENNELLEKHNDVLMELCIKLKK